MPRQRRFHSRFQPSFQRQETTRSLCYREARGNCTYGEVLERSRALGVGRRGHGGDADVSTTSVEPSAIGEWRSRIELSCYRGIEDHILVSGLWP
jgi:hypothetical protein